MKPKGERMKIEDAFAPLNNPERAASNQVFHTVETFFPLCGKIVKSFSIAWKIWAYFSTENELSAEVCVSLAGAQEFLRQSRMDPHTIENGDGDEFLGSLEENGECLERGMGFRGIGHGQGR